VIEDAPETVHFRPGHGLITCPTNSAAQPVVEVAEITPVDNLLAAAIELRQHGSHVEVDDQNQWWADLAPVNGPRLGPFPFACRQQALDAERQWLESHWLVSPES
jgi:hypothetical protein